VGQSPKKEEEYDPRVKALKIVLALLVAGGALYLLRNVFLSSLGESPRAASPQAVLFSAPSGYAIDEAGAVSRTEAAQRLRRAFGDGRPSSGGIGIHFTSDGFDLYWLIDPGGEARLVERAAGPSGTRQETEYHGDLAARLAWAAEHGIFDAPGLTAGEGRNLYH
jgi:hypothetical protein